MFMTKLNKLLFTFLILVLCSCIEEKEVVVIITPSNEECDDYDCIWKIDSVIQGDPKILSKQIYMLNSKKSYNDSTTNVRYKLNGLLYDKIIKEDFTNCGVVYEFLDEQIENIH